MSSVAKPRVVIPDFITDAMEVEREILGDIATIEALDAKCEEDLFGKIEDVSAIILFHTLILTRNTLTRLRNCKLIVRAGVGFDNVDHRFARELGVPVANVPDYGTEEVADSAIGLTLALLRGITLYNTRLRDPGVDWSFRMGVPLERLRGMVFGVVGVGRIGMATVARAKAFGMDVVFHDPYAPDGFDKALGARRVETLDELLKQSRVVSLHCPLSDETRHLINAESIAKMPRGSYLVNTSRGAVVDTSAIPDAIASGQLAGAGIDVLSVEPPVNDALVNAWRDPKHPASYRVILNPHAAFYSQAGLRDMRVKGAEACRRAILGLPLRNIVN